ncbi:sterol desaturase family protein [Mucilaginibacter aquatilis]|uniref:Fatty acid hydroxylase n=1 Tax=Mucilaginibacter aquatilis TaxID=1517760 RepID=A0A6I4IGH2_9SPHI|nr:sterol desaturase family protein [Mucilaginibacter aquatilis]MVN92646.1 fatty acid hydroxylase [Mucilaginibacter aquatilis]
MHVLINITIVLLTIIGMEAFSWFIHKYLFHGPLWFIHKTHHQERHGWFELNDIFSLGFAALSMWLMWVGRLSFDYRFFIGLGISLYGFIYFIFHDWFIHNRFKAFKTTNKYLLSIRRAHKIHHKSTQKMPSEEFGLLLANKKYFKR